ncbi:MAG: hypothetical protein WC916_00460 [Candidatus Woesearchaeota archaeon]
MEFKDGVLIVNRKLSALDTFTIKFIDLLKKYSSYVLISGYVSILLGRSRISEDIDLIVPKMDLTTFTKFEKTLEKKGFYCLNTPTISEMYSYLTQEKVAIRFAKKGTVIPNMEFKFAKNKTDLLALHDAIRVRINTTELKISDLEMQIAYKEQRLKSPKDMEDARHLRNILGLKLNKQKLKAYEAILRE